MQLVRIDIGGWLVDTEQLPAGFGVKRRLAMDCIDRIEPLPAVHRCQLAVGIVVQAKAFQDAIY